ncbi:7750_t:CDS:2, partial [Cetraspora pellucida]
SFKEKNKSIDTEMQNNHKYAQNPCHKAGSNYRKASSYNMHSVPSKTKVLEIAKAEEQNYKVRWLEHLFRSISKGKRTITMMSRSTEELEWTIDNPRNTIRHLQKKDLNKQIVEQERTETSHQLIRDESNSIHNNNIQGLDRKDSTDQDGQFSMCGISQPPGWGSSPEISSVAKAIWEICLERKIKLKTQHAPGIHNVIADYAFQLRFNKHDWMLNPKIFKKIHNRWAYIDTQNFSQRSEGTSLYMSNNTLMDISELVPSSIRYDNRLTLSSTDKEPSTPRPDIRHHTSTENKLSVKALDPNSTSTQMKENHTTPSPHIDQSNLPTESGDEIYDITPSLNYIVFLGDNDRLPLITLVKKTAFLCALSSACHGINKKRMKIFIGKYQESAELCLAMTLHHYVFRTKELRHSEDQKTALFLSNVGLHKPAAVDTTANWLKDIVRKSAPDGKAKDIRVLSALLAQNVGADLNSILALVNWSNLHTYQRFYQWGIKLMLEQNNITEKIMNQARGSYDNLL